MSVLMCLHVVLVEINLPIHKFKILNLSNGKDQNYFFIEKIWKYLQTDVIDLALEIRNIRLLRYWKSFKYLAIENSKWYLNRISSFWLKHTIINIAVTRCFCIIIFTLLILISWNCRQDVPKNVINNQLIYMRQIHAL